MGAQIMQELLALVHGTNAAPPPNAAMAAQAPAMGAPNPIIAQLATQAQPAAMGSATAAPASAAGAPTSAAGAPAPAAGGAGQPSGQTLDNQLLQAQIGALNRTGQQPSPWLAALQGLSGPAQEILAARLRPELAPPAYYSPAHVQGARPFDFRGNPDARVLPPASLAAIIKELL